MVVPDWPVNVWLSFGLGAVIERLPAFGTVVAVKLTLLDPALAVMMATNVELISSPAYPVKKVLARPFASVVPERVCSKPVPLVMFQFTVTPAAGAPFDPVASTTNGSTDWYCDSKSWP